MGRKCHMATLGASGVVLAGILFSGTVAAQTSDRAERLTVRPDVETTLPRSGASQLQPDGLTGSLRITPQLRQQLQAIGREKRSWTPLQRKINPRLLLEYKNSKGLPAHIDLFPGAPVQFDQDGTTLVDIKGNVTPEVLARIEALGGDIINSHPRYGAIRARIPIDQIEDIANTPDIKSIRPAERAITRKLNVTQGDVAHRSNIVRASFGVTGAGKKACAMSDSVDHLATVQASGDLPPNIDILPGQAGTGTGEGTAMLEIMFDQAPAASLGFASAFGGQAQFAQNIRDLRFNAGCDVIVDDVIYFAEPVFQDGIIAKAVDDVAADGALYFSSIGNGNNLNEFSPFSGTWEGDFRVGPDLGPSAGISHDWTGTGANLNRIVSTPNVAIILQWSDPVGASGNDYDLYLIDPAITTVVGASVAVQDGNDDPFEGIGIPAGTNITNFWVLVTKFRGVNRMIHVNMFGGLLGVATAGNGYGHATARGAIGVGAVRADNLGGQSFLAAGTNQVEFFSSDGPRRIHYNADGSAITPGNVSASGGEVRQKPEIAAANRVATATPGFGLFAGTSAAAPHAAAIATLMLSSPSNPSPAAVRQTMFATAIDIEAAGIDRDSGHGIVDAFSMLDKPDLIAQWIKLKPSCLATETNCRIKGRLTVANQGFGAASGETTARIYYSTDGTLDPAGDIQLAQFSVSALAAGTIQVNPVKLSVPGVTTDTSGATVYVQLDVNESVLESNELNNQGTNDTF